MLPVEYAVDYQDEEGKLLRMYFWQHLDEALAFARNTENSQVRYRYREIPVKPWKDYIG